MLEKVKLALRIKSDAFNIEIESLILACKTDLHVSGIQNILENDALIEQAIKLYCKANFGLDNKDSEKYLKSYEMLKTTLALSGNYNVV